MASPYSLSIRVRVPSLSAPRIIRSSQNATPPYQLQARMRSPQSAQTRAASTSARPENKADSTQLTTTIEDDVRPPRSVQAAYLRPLKRRATHGYPACDLQLRSYSVRNVEFMADFALRAAYYLKMPASGPIPLPKLVQRWTVPRSNFVHKKSQENFERVTLRRLVQVQDAHPETVQIWLAFLRKHAFYGVGMKANVFANEALAVGESMDAGVRDLQPAMEQQWSLFGREKKVDQREKVIDSMHADKIRSGGEGTLLRRFDK